MDEKDSLKIYFWLANKNIYKKYFIQTQYRPVHKSQILSDLIKNDQIGGIKRKSKTIYWNW